MLVAADETTEEKKERETKEIEFERRESVLSTSGVSCIQSAYANKCTNKSICFVEYKI